MKLTVKKVVHSRRGRKRFGRRESWFVVGLPWAECGLNRCGPYSDYQEARSDCRGMQSIFQNEEYK